MNWRHCRVSSLVILLVVGVASASTYSVDPIWVAGAYDDGDYDATALAISSPDALVRPPPPPTPPSRKSAFLSGTELASEASTGNLRGALATRAPPPA